MRSSWRLMTPPQHLFFFSKTSLAAILGRAGFQLVEVARPSKLVRLSRIAFPVNLLDALRVIFVKDRSI